jgi:hypothetical protein
MRDTLKQEFSMVYIFENGSPSGEHIGEPVKIVLQFKNEQQ